MRLQNEVGPAPSCKISFQKLYIIIRLHFLQFMQCNWVSNNCTKWNKGTGQVIFPEIIKRTFIKYSRVSKNYLRKRFNRSDSE